MSVSADPRIGSELLGYRVEALVGRGGMGVVYRAYDPRLKRNVALKLVAPELAADERFRERFLAESELAASLEHPNVVPIHDAGIVDGQLAVAMRYVEGTDLKSLLRAKGALEPKRALKLVAQLGDALDAAHRRGLVHRDVKPSNALLDTAENVYLADFGLTKSAAEGADAAGFAGTVEYVAPEQIEGKPVDGRADVYSLGCLLYECLTGEVPYPRSSKLAALWAHLQERPPSASERNPALSDAIDPVIARAMAKEPGERYATCSELVEAAREALGVREVVLVRERRPLLLAAAGIALALAAALSAFFLSRNDNSPPKPSTKPTVAPNTDSLQRIDPKTNKLAATIGIGEDPTAVAVGAGSVWVASQKDQAVLRIDPRANRPTGNVTTGGPNAIAVGNGSVWVANSDFTLTRVDPATLAIDTSENSGYLSAAIGNGALWMLGFRGLVRVNREGRIVRTIPNVGYDPFVVAAGGGAVWVLDDAPGRIWRVDPASSRVVAGIRLGFDPGGMAFGRGRVWVTNNGGDALVAIDPATNRIARSIRVGDGPVGVAVGEGFVWVANYRDGTVSRIDPSRGSVAANVSVGRYPTHVATGAGGAWVTVRAG